MQHIAGVDRRASPGHEIAAVHFEAAVARWKSLRRNDERRLRRIAARTGNARLRRAAQSYLRAYGGFCEIGANVRGLPLALAVAGAHRTLLTLDNVPDRTSVHFMARFYENVAKRGMSYVDAFVQTKRDAWAGKIAHFDARWTYAYVLFEH